MDRNPAIFHTLPGFISAERDGPSAPPPVPRAAAVPWRGAHSPAWSLEGSVDTLAVVLQTRMRGEIWKILTCGEIFCVCEIGKTKEACMTNGNHN